MADGYVNNHFVPLVILKHWEGTKFINGRPSKAVWRYEVTTKLSKDSWCKNPVPFPWLSAKNLYVPGDGERRNLSLEILFGRYESALGRFIDFSKTLPKRPEAPPVIDAPELDVRGIIRGAVSLEFRSRHLLKKTLAHYAQAPNPQETVLINLQAQISDRMNSLQMG